MSVRLWLFPCVLISYESSRFSTSLLNTAYRLFGAQQGLDADGFHRKYNVNGSSEKFSVVRAALAAAFYPNIGYADRTNGKVVTK